MYCCGLVRDKFTRTKQIQYTGIGVITSNRSNATLSNIGKYITWIL